MQPQASRRPEPAGAPDAPRGPVGAVPESGNRDRAGAARPTAATSPAGISPAGTGPAGLPRSPLPPGKQPSWASVIATTIRLWLERRTGLGRQRSAPSPRGNAAAPSAAPSSGTYSPQRSRSVKQRRRAAIFGAVIVVFAAGGLTFALAGHAGAPPRSAHARRPPKLGPAALAAATANRKAAATWAAEEVSHSVVVSCDPVMCATLQQDGFPAGDLLPLSASANDPLGSGVVMSTIALRNQFGARLPDVYAPAVLATFGTGETRVDVRIEAPQGGQAYLVAQRADLLARQMAGQQLVANKNLHVTGLAEQEIAEGNLDSRVLITLAALTAQVHHVTVAAVGDSGPGATPGIGLRMVQINTLVRPGHPVINSNYLKSVLNFLKAQQPPYLADVTVLHPPGRTLVQVVFPAPGPLGLLGERTSS